MKNLEKTWVRLKQSIARGGAISYTEISRLEVPEFFIMVNDLEAEAEKAKAPQRRQRK